MDWLKSVARRVRKLSQLSWFERLLALRVVALLVLIRVGLWMLPFRRVQAFAKWTGKKVSSRSRLTPEQLTSLVSVGAEYVPGASCLTQALVAQAMLSRFGYEPIVRIGVAREAGSGFEAHAWIEYEGRVIIGQVGKLERFTTLPSIHAAQTK